MKFVFGYLLRTSEGIEATQIVNSFQHMQSLSSYFKATKESQMSFIYNFSLQYIRNYKLLLKFSTRPDTCIISYSSIQSVQRFSHLYLSFSHWTFSTVLLIVYYWRLWIRFICGSLVYLVIIGQPSCLNLTARVSSFMIS